MVDGTGLENQQINVSQVRILSLPPIKEKKPGKRSFPGKLRTIKIESLLSYFYWTKSA